MLNKVESQKSKVKSQRNVTSSVLVFLASIFFPITTNAQCAMCRAALESEGNQTKAQAVNDGIVYLMAIPYILAIIVGYAVYRMQKKKKTT